MAGALLGLPSCRTPGPRAPATAERPAPLPLTDPVQAMWVARFHYRFRDDIETFMANCAALGCNTVYWQVRGEGTVSYPSQLEPWSREYDFQHPGFDPLAVAVDAAHRHGLRIEAYINVMPGWKGKEPPPPNLDPPQLYHAHPEWFMHDAKGYRQPLGDFYVILNPCLPEVREHIVAVVTEILANYAVDGIHLDYVRYAWDESPNAKQAYPRDPRTVRLYHQATGKHPDDDPTAWTQWRARQLTRLVGQIRRAVNRARPGASLTAAVWRDPTRGYNEYLQNAVAWLRTGLLDGAAPMAYSDDPALFTDEIASYRQLVQPARVIPGVGLYKHTQPDTLQAQMGYCATTGGAFALFSYESLFPTHADRSAKPATLAQHQQQRHMRREIVEYFAR